MYYMVETLQNCGYRCRKAVKLESDNLRAARKEATGKQFFQGTILYIGTEIDRIGFMTEADLVYQNGKWQKCREDRYGQLAA
jgi:hypothetical protein